jgi:hypothetical protein
LCKKTYASQPTPDHHPAPVGMDRLPWIVASLANMGWRIVRGAITRNIDHRRCQFEY